jgi:uncharacterized damage-inducible protein DinB
MTASDFLAHLLRKQTDGLFEAVRELPADKLDWKPAPESRSALDQLQEIATVFDGIPDAITNRKLDFSPEKMAEWQAKRQQLTNLEALEKMARAATDRLIEFAKTVKPEEWNDPVEMPWPGDFRVADLLSYHYWNMAYHQGQIYYIGTLLSKS